MIGFWHRLQLREQRLILTALLVISGVLVWLLVIEPMQRSSQALRDQIAGQLALQDWLERVTPEVRQLRQNEQPDRSLGGRSALSVIDQSARAAGLAGALKRIEPGAGGEVRVVFEQAAFPDLMNWLARLVGERPLAVETFSADRSRAAGRVDCVVVLRGPDATGSF
ncbi:MAG: type II secretion system protein M [Xanthomonadaceae bacterium]|nr:type II secretion system protein M [Xanthomonadaceae bacterium]